MAPIIEALMKFQMNSNVRRAKTWRKINLKKMRSNPFIISFQKVEDRA